MRWILCLLLFLFLAGECLAIDFDKVKFGRNKDRSQEMLAQQAQAGPSQCGVKVNLPAGWRIERNEADNVLFAGPQGMWVHVVMSEYKPDFPTAASLQAYKIRAEEEKQEGILIACGERIIDGVAGVQRVEAPQAAPDDPRRITWIGYRGTTGINIVASSKSRDFDGCYPQLDNFIVLIKW